MLGTKLARGRVCKVSSLAGPTVAQLKDPFSSDYKSVIHEPFSLFHRSVLILFDCFSVMIHCNCNEASLQAKKSLCFNNKRI